MQNTALAAAAAGFLPAGNLFAANVDKKIRLAFIGVGLRGQGHLNNALLRPDTEIAAICDVDDRMLDMATALIKKAGKPLPPVFKGDPYAYRRLLDLKNIDGIIIASKQAINPLPIDVSHLAVTGCSYAGKMALFAGAFDERIALTVAQENGGGGQPSWRVSHDIEALRAVESIDVTDYNWFGSQMRQFNGNNIYKLPEDHHELAAMIAPRALLQTGNTNFYWLSNGSNYVSSRATQRVYNQFGIGDRFGFYIDGGHPHCGTLAAEAPVIGAYLDKFLLDDATANTDVEVTPYPNLDYSRWTWWWGTAAGRCPRPSACRP